MGLDQLDGLVPGSDVDAGVRVGERVVGAPVGPAHVVEEGTDDGATVPSSSSTSLASVSGTGTGYSPERQAVQNDAGDAPVAVSRRSSSRYASESTPRKSRISPTDMSAARSSERWPVSIP